MNRADTEKLLTEADGRFYVYVLQRPDGTPFYVDKGKGRRVSFHEIEARGDGCSHNKRIDEELHGRAAPGERGIANRFYLELCESVRPVPIRPLSAFTPKALKPHRSVRTPTPRMAATLAASAIANRVLLEPGCRIPRRLTVDGTDLCIENGAGADILKAGLATLLPAETPQDERFLVGKDALISLLGNCDNRILIDAGVLEPSL